MKRIATIVAAGAVLAAAYPAAAQDMSSYLGMFSAVADGMGQSVGQAIGGSHSVFVYAQGHVKISGQLAAPAKGEPYQVQLAFSAPTAVEAAGRRDALLSRIAAVAQRFHVAMKTSQVALTLGDACGSPSQRVKPACLQRMAMGQARAGAAEKPEPAGAAQFSATADVSLTAPDVAQAPAFLDALHAAGVDTIDNADEVNTLPYLLARSNPFASTGTIDNKVWDDAARDAVREARRQAEVLAQSDGRNVGEARQILFLARTVSGDEATVTVAVRFDLKGSKP